MCCDIDALEKPSEEELSRLMSGNRNEVDRAVSVLGVAVNLFEDLQRGSSLSHRHTHLEEVSKLTGVSAPIILYAYKHGTLEAHDLFVKEEIKLKSSKRSDIPAFNLVDGDFVPVETPSESNVNNNN